MTDDEKKKLLDGFKKPDEEDLDDGYWTDQRLLAVAKQIIERLGINGKLQ